MKVVDDSSFDQVVRNAKKPVLVDFYTDSCGPCRMLAPVLESLAKEMAEVTFVKVDADNSEVADEFDISVVPTLILFEDGEEVSRKEGLLPKPKLKEWIENQIS